MNIFENAKWIWRDGDAAMEEYVSFEKTFNCDPERVCLFIAAETDYIAYVNEKRVSFNQFSGYRNEKYYDEIGISFFCQKGENTLRVTVRHEGVNSACRISDGAGLIFSVRENEKEIAFSDEDTLSSLSSEYTSYIVRHITGQLGLSSTMDSREKKEEKKRSREVSLCRNLLPRPVKPLEILEKRRAVPIEVSGRRIYDLGREECGYLYLRVKCESEGLVRVVYGEHVTDGCVRYRIGGRDFSLDFNCRAGESYFEQLFVRVAGRYFEVFGDTEVLEIGIIPVLYPLTEKPIDEKIKGLDRRIYETAVRTLRLCMHTHYEDCPWREQALYVLDSRNQMLCGYDAFFESDFQRANLVFISKGKREDSLLELTYPAVNTPAIPFFSVMYPVAVYEYVCATGDKSIIPEVVDTMRGIMNTLYGRITDRGLVPNLPPPYWNFYEWSDFSSGHNELGNNAPRAEKYDLILNCAFVYSAERFSALCKEIGESADFDLDSIKEAVSREFFMPESGAFKLSSEYDTVSQLGCAFALLVGLGDERTLSFVRCEREGVIPATLSMLGYVYDALIKSDENAVEFVLDDIRKKYSYMLEKGATSFWETINGDSDFANAGSLCHGWSAMPIYYLNRLL